MRLRVDTCVGMLGEYLSDYGIAPTNLFFYVFVHHVPTEKYISPLQRVTSHERSVFTCRDSLKR